MVSNQWMKSTIHSCKWIYFRVFKILLDFQHAKKYIVFLAPQKCAKHIFHGTKNSLCEFFSSCSKTTQCLSAHQNIPPIFDGWFLTKIKGGILDKKKIFLFMFLITVVIGFLIINNNFTNQIYNLTFKPIYIILVFVFLGLGFLLIIFKNQIKFLKNTK